MLQDVAIFLTTIGGSAMIDERLPRCARALDGRVVEIERKLMQTWRAIPVLLGAALAQPIAPMPAPAQYLTVFGGPTYDATLQTGYSFQGVQFAPGSPAGNGIAVGFANKYSGGVYLGERAIRWDASG